MVEAQRHVVAYRVVEQESLLWDQRNRAGQHARSQVTKIEAVQQYATFVGVDQPGQEGSQGRLAGWTVNERSCNTGCLSYLKHNDST